jgi:Ca-activated chloride channel homolog
MTARSALTLLAMCGATLAAAPQDTPLPTFSSRLEAVRVDVLVTEDGRPVRGLKPADFEIRDEGVTQTVDLVSFEQIPLNVVLALDVSDSVSGDRLDHLRGAGRAVLGKLAETDQAGLVSFNNAVELRANLSGNTSDVATALADVQPSGETALVDGSFAAMVLAQSAPGTVGNVRRGLVIVFTDGADTISWLTPERVLDAARRNDAVVYGVIVRSKSKASFLHDLSERTGGGIVEIESTKDLADRFLAILDEFRQRYLVSYTPRGVGSGGWHRLDVRIKGRKASVKARAGYVSGP